MISNVISDHVFETVIITHIINVRQTCKGNGTNGGIMRASKSHNVTGSCFGTDQDIGLIGRCMGHLSLQYIETRLRLDIVQEFGKK